MNHKRIKIMLTILGCLLLCAGITLSVIGFANFGNFDNNLFTLTLAGLPCTAFGIGLLGFAFQGNISRFVAKEQAPAINEFTEKITPAIQSHAQAVKDVLTNETNKVCPSCNQRIDCNDKFCSNCGTKID